MLFFNFFVILYIVYNTNNLYLKSNGVYSNKMLKNKTLKVILIVSGIVIALVILIAPIQLLIANKYIEQGNENLKKHFYKSAFLDYEKASALIPTDEKLKIQMGDIYFLKNNFEAAEKEYRKAYKINKNNSEALALLLETLLKEKKMGDAFKVINSASAKVLESVEIEILKARIFASIGKLDDAFNIIKNENGNEAKFYEAVFLTAERDFKNAEELLESLEEDSIKDKVSVIKKAFEKIKSSENETYKTVVLAQVLNEIDEPYLAEILLKEILEKNPTYRDALIFLGYANYLKKDYKKADNYLLEAIKIDSIYGLSYYFLSKVNLEENKKEDAILNLENALAFGWKNEETYKLLGELLLEQKNYSKAEENFKKAYELNSRNEEVLTGLLESLIKQGKLDEAFEYSQKNGAEKFTGWVYLEKGELEKSLEELKKAEEKEPYSAFISLKLGELLKKQAKISEAKEYFRKTIEYDLEGKWSKKAENELKQNR